MSAFSTIIDRLDNLTESQLRQLYLIVGVRVGIANPGATGQVNPAQTRRNVGKLPARPGSGRPGGNTKTAKGNPSRKSQWETHPLYREYKRLKKVVEHQAKEAKTSFASVDSAEREAYNEALSRWLEAKSSFRDRSGPKEEAAGETPAISKEVSSKKIREGADSSAGKPVPGRLATSKEFFEHRSRAISGPEASWADEVQDAVMEDPDESSSSESETGAAAAAASVTSKPKRGAASASLSSRATPAKGRGGSSAS